MSPDWYAEIHPTPIEPISAAQFDLAATHKKRKEAHEQRWPEKIPHDREAHTTPIDLPTPPPRRPLPTTPASDGPSSLSSEQPFGPSRSIAPFDDRSTAALSPSPQLSFHHVAMAGKRLSSTALRLAVRSACAVAPTAQRPAFAAAVAASQIRALSVSARRASDTLMVVRFSPFLLDVALPPRLRLARVRRLTW